MKVIPVTGTSGSGKTTFIRSLLPLLARHGPVGAVKHIGHHAMELPVGKDTTIMFDAGTRAVAGIDQEKTIVTLRSTSVIDALDLLAGLGVAFAVVEGFKGSAWPKVIIGDLDAEECLLRNPLPEDVVRSLDRFPDYTTLEEILRELGEICREKEQACAMAAAVFLLPAGLEEDTLSSIGQELSALVGSMEALPGITGAQAAIRHGSLFGGTDEILVAVAAETGDEAASALQIALLWCGESLEGP